MATRKIKPTTPGRRFLVAEDFSTITRRKPEKKLTRALPSSGGRNNTGRTTVMHRGGGHKRRYRLIDFWRDKHDIPAVVKTIEYDPVRSARIALLFYRDGEKRYILAHREMRVGDKVVSGEKVPPEAGNAMPLKSMPIGTFVHNVAFRPGGRAGFARSAGTYAQLVAREGEYATLKLPSGETRMVLVRCYATVGVVSNVQHSNVCLGKAGRSRWLGRRPGVRGVVKNPVDGPMGGGEGKSKSGKQPQSPTGVLAKGKRTRPAGKRSSRLILKRRK